MLVQQPIRLVKAKQKIALAVVYHAIKQIPHHTVHYVEVVFIIGGIYSHTEHSIFFVVNSIFDKKNWPSKSTKFWEKTKQNKKNRIFYRFNQLRLVSKCLENLLLIQYCFIFLSVYSHTNIHPTYIHHVSFAPISPTSSEKTQIRLPLKMVKIKMKNSKIKN